MWQQMEKGKYFSELRIIKDRYERLWKPRIDPYAIYDWIMIFTPIEYNVWSDIRSIGVPLYPQFPVGKYWIDFADPIKKIGIEVNGKIHNQTTDRDTKRLKELACNGYTIFNISGKDTFAEDSDSYCLINTIRNQFYS